MHSSQGWRGAHSTPLGSARGHRNRTPSRSSAPPRSGSKGKGKPAVHTDCRGVPPPDISQPLASPAPSVGRSLASPGTSRWVAANAAGAARNDRSLHSPPPAAESVKPERRASPRPPATAEGVRRIVSHSPSVTVFSSYSRPSTVPVVDAGPGPLGAKGVDKSNVIVSVRIRPILASGMGTRREEDVGGSNICMSADPGLRQVTIWDPADRARRDKKRVFSYDHVYDSTGGDGSPSYSGQAAIYQDIGIATIEQAFKGYNTCIFAYGQTSSGKTYTMMGPDGAHLGRQLVDADGHMHRETGMIPRICTDLFSTIASQIDLERVAIGGVSKSYRVECSFFEIYNEKVYDLFEREDERKAYRVREHPRRGPYIEGLNKTRVSTYQEIERLLKRGGQNRHTAATLMNDHSSRSHAVCEIILTCSKFEPGDDDLQETVSRMELVDLAGSERSDYAGTTGERLLEGSNINKSLLTLGNVIESLASNSERRSKQAKFVQYRDSTLTWLLREALGGNSKTFMVATLSPSVLNYEESLSTLKYADRAKKIQNIARINQDSKKAIIFNLRQEINVLRAQLERLQVPKQYDDAGMGTDGTMATSPSADHTQVEHGSLFINRCDPYLLQRKPLPGLREPVVYWLEAGTTYISCEDHSGHCNVARSHASSSRPLDKSLHTILLPATKGIMQYHALFSREADAVFIDATCGSAYTGPSLNTARTDTSSNTPDVLLDGMPLEPGGDGERLTCGASITVGGYTWTYVDPSNIDEMVSFQRQCNTMERAKAAQDKSIQTITRRVRNILSGAGLQVDDLPTTPEHRGDYSGQTTVCRSPHGPEVLVWEPEGASGTGSWERTQDVFLAEAAAVQAIDRRKAEYDMGQRLASLVSDHLALTDIPPLDRIPVPKGTDTMPRLVRSPRAGLKVVQWSTQASRWERASDTVALIAARGMVQDRKLATVESAARSSASHHSEELERKERELAELRESEESLRKELASQAEGRDKLLLQHREEAKHDRTRLQAQLDALVDDSEKRLQIEKSIRCELEQNLEDARYQIKKAESMHEVCLAAKDKAIAKMQALQNDNASLDAEVKNLRGDNASSKKRLTLVEEQLVAAKIKISDLDELRRATGTDALQEKNEKLTADLAAAQESFQSVSRNLRTLSDDYAKLRQEELDNRSRMSSIRETLESNEQEVGQLTAERGYNVRQIEELKRDLESVRSENRALVKRQKEREEPQQKQFQTLQKRFADLEAQLAQTTTRGSYSDKRTVELSTQKQHLQKQLKDTLEKYTSNKRRVDELKASNDDFSRRNDTLKVEVTQMQTQLRMFRSSRTVTDEKHESMQLSIQLGLAQQENAKLQAELRDHRRMTKDALGGGQEKLREECMRLRDQLRESEARGAAQDAQLRDAKGRAERERMARQGQEEEVRYLQGELRVARQTAPTSGDSSARTRATNPFGPPLSTPDPTQTGTPRPPADGAVRASEVEREARQARRRGFSGAREPGYMKATLNWSARDDQLPVPRGNSPTRPDDAPRRSRTGSIAEDRRLRRSNSNSHTPRGPRVNSGC